MRQIQFVCWLSSETIKEILKTCWVGFGIRKLKPGDTYHTFYSHLIYLGFIEIRVWHKGMGDQ